MRTVLSWTYAILLFAAAGAAAFALLNWLGWSHTQLWAGAVFGVVNCLLGPRLMKYCYERGWIRGVFFDPKKRAELAERKRKLAEKWQQLEAERQTILRNARK